jgi:5'-nucleotidase
MEGTLAGIPSIALSQVYTKEGVGNNVRFDAAEDWGARAIAPLLETPFAARTLININFPPLPAAEVRGIKAVRQGFHDYARGSLVEAVDPRGFPYFWFGLHGIEHTPGHDTDLEAIAEGFVTVTPLQLDLTHEGSLAGLKARYA